MNISCVFRCVTNTGLIPVLLLFKKCILWLIEEQWYHYRVDFVESLSAVYIKGSSYTVVKTLHYGNVLCHILICIVMNLYKILGLRWPSN